MAYEPNLLEFVQLQCDDIYKSSSVVKLNLKGKHTLYLYISIHFGFGDTKYTSVILVHCHIISCSIIQNFVFINLSLYCSHCQHLRLQRKLYCVIGFFLYVHVYDIQINLGQFRHILCSQNLR